MNTREIKFRAWNPSAKTMYPNVMVHGNDIVIAKYNTEPDSEDPLIEPITYSINSKPNWVLMQCTGLKDKNGKEIYEGDILKSSVVKGVVSFENGTFVWQKEPLGWDLNIEYPEVLNPNEWSEIIGNIYENPELL